MTKLLMAALGSALLATTATAQTTWTQSLDNVNVLAGSIGCNQAQPNPGYHAENSFWRSYSPATQMQTTNFEIASITFGVENASAPQGAQSAEIRIYSDPTPGDPAPAAGLTLLHTESFMVMDTTGALLTQTMNPPVPFNVNGDDLVVEFYYPDGIANLEFFFIGSNGAGQTAPGYLWAPTCGATEPTDIGLLGFPTMHIILDVNIVPLGGITLGNRYCSSAVNSTGMESNLIIFGSLSVTDNDMGLRATNAPAGQTGIFYYGPDQIQVPFGDGWRCVGGQAGSVKRIFPFAMTNGQGNMEQTADNTAPAHALCIGVAGTTLNFQGWFRDPAAAMTGFNLTDGVECTMEP